MFPPMTEASSTRYSRRLYIRVNTPNRAQAPLLLPLFSLLPNAQSHPIPTAVFYSLVDLVNANALVTISDSGQAVSGRFYSALRKHIRWDGVSIAAW